ncbi:hypothetical protein CO614_10550 [Lysobacteraceae bacterium NML120232]|nr:hypothetical protein CO614_10550 [Xanthomonadaceae bacterium NML120232]PJK10325.1 hypothetical protein CO608_06585 [Xanthomonadaceae bacterium NML08-0793]
MKKALITAVLGSVAMLACAQEKTQPTAATPEAPTATAAAQAASIPKPAPGSAGERALKAIQGLNPNIKIDDLAEAPLPGFQQVIVGGQTLFVSDDGRYLLQGSLFDMQEKKDLSSDALSKMRQRLLAQVPRAERIVFPAANPKHVVTVFTDVECGYCRRLHNAMDEYNKLGITVEYLAFPRMGPASPDFALMEAVWCSNNRNKALTDAKNGKHPQAVRCTNPVMSQWTLGQQIGLQGTPMIIGANGQNTPGYMPPEQLLQWLEATQK